jgi:acetylglutamate kinase
MSKKYEVELVYCFEKTGVLTDAEDPSSKIDEINLQLYEDLKASGSIHSGMIPKIDTAISALRNGVSAVSIIHFTEFEKYQASRLSTGTRLVI